MIWPTWPERSQDEISAAGAPLADTQDYWREAGTRLRDAAKWTATALGAGLVLVGITLILVLLVMCPKSVSLNDVQNAHRRGPGWAFLSLRCIGGSARSNSSRTSICPAA